MSLSQSIEEAKKQGHQVFSFTEESGLVFHFREPNKSELMLFQDNAARGSAAVAQEKFLRSLFVGDNAEEFHLFLEKKPLSIGQIFELLLDDMGLNVNFTKAQV